MNNKIDFTNHIIFTSSQNIIDICKPLFESFNTTYFNFVRRYDDGSEICLTTNTAWTEYFYVNKLYNQVLADKYAQRKSLVSKLKIIPWAQFANSPVRLAQSKLFNVGIGISLIFNKNGYSDFFHFGTNNENTQMSSLYVNYSSCLVQFAYYFYDKANKIIAEASKPKNRLFITDRVFLKKDDPNPSIDGIDIKKFLETTQPKRFAINNSAKEIHLSKKEIICINLIMRGKTAQEIGDMLFISKRTVETHIMNSKTKLGLGTGTNKSDLVKALIDGGLDLNDLILC